MKLICYREEYLVQDCKGVIITRQAKINDALETLRHYDDGSIKIVHIEIVNPIIRAMLGAAKSHNAGKVITIQMMRKMCDLDLRAAKNLVEHCWDKKEVNLREYLHVNF